MKFEICSVYDSKAAVYSRPFFVHNLSLAERVALDILRGESDIARHPDDFSLFHLGSFDDGSAKFDLFDGPQALFRFHELASAFGV